MILGKTKRGKTTLKINSLVIYETNSVVQNSQQTRSSMNTLQITVVKLILKSMHYVN